MKKYTITAVIALIVGLIAGYAFFHSTTRPLGSSATTFTSLQIGNSGSIINQDLQGTCTIFAYASTIAATSTGDVECQSGSNVLTAIAGITLGDNIFATLSTSTPTTVGGLVLESASASTTAGYIHMKILNLTGTTFTWTAAASSSVVYLDLK